MATPFRYLNLARAVRSARSAAAGTAQVLGLCLALVACGEDEILDIPEAPSTTSSALPPEPGQLDICAAVASVLRTPSVPEALCAGTINRDPNNPLSFETQCQQCALVAGVIFAFAPEPACPKVYADCSATTSELTTCTQDAAKTLAETAVGCNGDAGGSPSQEALQRAFATPSCLQVLFKCPAVVDALLGSLALPGAAAPADAGNGRNAGAR